MIKQTLLVAALASCAIAVFAGVANASPAEVIRDCTQDSVLDKTYSKADLKAALKLVVGDTAEYTECQSVIEGALSKSATHKNGGSGRSSSGSGGPVSQVAANRATRKKIAKQVEKDSKLNDSAPIAKLDGGNVKRAGGHTLASSTAPGIPTALIVALAGMLLLFGTDLAARLAKMPQMAILSKIIPKRRRNGSDH